MVSFCCDENVWYWMGWWLPSTRNVLSVLMDTCRWIFLLWPSSHNIHVYQIILIFYNAVCQLLLWFSYSVMFDSLWPHGLEHASLPCPSVSPRVCSNSCALSQWCHSTISSSVVPFSCPQSSSTSGSFPMSQFFPLGGQSIGASVSASVLPINIQDWFSLGLTGWISLQSKGLLSLLQHHKQKNQFFGTQPSLWSDSHICTWLLEKPKLWLYGPLSAVMTLLFNMLSRFVIAFLPRSKSLLISWLQSPSPVIWEPKKKKFLTVSNFSPSICHEVSYISIKLGKIIKWLNLCRFPFSLKKNIWSQYGGRNLLV